MELERKEKVDAEDVGSNTSQEETIVVPSLRSARSIMVIASACLAMIMNSSSIQALVLAIPSMQRDLNISELNLQWLVTAYALTSGCFLIFFARIADIFGRKPVFIAGCLWFIGFSIGCGFARDGMTIIILRAFAGMGGAAVVPATVGILAVTFPPSHARTVAFSMFQAGAPTGGALGSVMGGLTTQYAPISWRALFFVAAGIGAIVLTGGIISFPNIHNPPADKRVDGFGAVLITSGLILLMFCLGQGEIAPEAWNTPYIIALLVVAGILLTSFIAWEYYVETYLTLPPFMKLSLFKRGKGKFSAVLIVAFLIMGAFSSWQYWATLYYQDYQGLEPIDTTIRFIPMNVVGVLINVIFALIAAHVSGHLLIVCGCLGTATACILFALINPETTYWAFGFPAAVLDVCGADFTMAGGALFIAKLALPQEQSLAGGMFNTVISLGVSFTTTVTTIVYDRSVKAESAREGIVLNVDGSNASLTTLLYGYRRAFWTSFSFAVFAALVASIVLRGIGIIGVKAVQNPVPNAPTNAAVSSTSVEEKVHGPGGAVEPITPLSGQTAAVPEEPVRRESG